MNPRSEPIPEQDDEEIAGVRAARHKISERFAHDPYRLVAYYMERQQQYLDRLVRASEPGTTSEVSGQDEARDRVVR